ncbi:MAG: rhomboid family intramembrane serine protease [Candidatus Paceibacterota bacterium]|jgi:membrane associated rhomboid family serine protease
MIPLYDESRQSKRTPWITFFLIVLNAVIFFVSLDNSNGFIETYGFYPSDIVNGSYLRMFTSLFLHANFWHLLGNIWFLWVFGDNLERKLGGFKFLLFYLLCGAGAALLYAFSAVNQDIPVIGASGAISGVMGGYLVFFARNKIKTLVPLIFIWTLASVPAVFFIIFWFVLQIVGVLVGSGDMVAYWGHIGGFAAGIALALFIKKFK